MEIIEELEDRAAAFMPRHSLPRFRGHLDSCIAIDMVMKNRRLTFSWRGIVADSTPQGEYEESVNKSKALLGHWKERIAEIARGTVMILLLDNYDSLPTTSAVSRRIRLPGRSASQRQNHGERYRVSRRIVSLPAPATPKRRAFVELVERLAENFPSSGLPRPFKRLGCVGGKIIRAPKLSIKTSRPITTTRISSASCPNPSPPRATIP